MKQILLTGVKYEWPTNQSCTTTPASLENSNNDNKYSVTVVLPNQHKCIIPLTNTGSLYEINYDNMEQNQPVGIEVLEWLNGTIPHLEQKNTKFFRWVKIDPNNVSSELVDLTWPEFLVVQDPPTEPEPEPEPPIGPPNDDEGGDGEEEASVPMQANIFTQITDGGTNTTTASGWTTNASVNSGNHFVKGKGGTSFDKMIPIQLAVSNNGTNIIFGDVIPSGNTELGDSIQSGNNFKTYKECVSPMQIGNGVEKKWVFKTC